MVDPVNPNNPAQIKHDNHPDVSHGDKGVTRVEPKTDNKKIKEQIPQK